MAEAAIAGANPATTTQLPDLRSARATSASDVQVCFDKPLSQSSAVLSNPQAIYLDGYASDNNHLDPVAATIDPGDDRCVDLTFDARAGQLDLGQFTVATADYSAVQTAGGQVNLADSTTLLSSDTHNGTVGLTDAPDLVGPAPVAYSSSTPNTIEYVFDQSVDPNAIDPTKFWFEDAQGNYCYGSSAQYSANDVYVTFTAGAGITFGGGGSGGSTGGCADADVANARRAGVSAAGVYDVSSDEVGNVPEGMSMPDNAGTTVDADPVSATIDSSGDQVTYTFDKPVTAGTPGDFFVGLSDGTVLQGDRAANAGPDSITVTFDGGTFDTNLANYYEYAVQAGISNGAAATTANGSGMPASMGTMPIGGNAGAFARGFTTGPDAYAATIDPAQDTATILFDQRVAYYDFTYVDPRSSDISGDAPYIVEFLNAQGAVLGPPSSIVIPTFPNPGPEAITMDVDHALIAQGIAAIALDPAGAGQFGSPAFLGYNSECAFDTAVTYAESSDNGCSVPQILAPTVSAARIRALRPVRRSRRARARDKGEVPHRGRRAHAFGRGHRARRLHRSRRASRDRRRG